MSLKDEFSIPDRYKVISQIGKGAYGIVAKGYDLKTKRYVFAFSTQIAIKKESNIFLSVIDARRMYREMYLMEKMNHPCILKLYDISTPDKSCINEIYLYEELMDTDLSSYISNKKHLSHEVIKEITYKMVCGLNYMHHRHVIHRDLKPSNILISNNDLSVKICDFGLSRIVADEDIYRYTQDEFAEKPSGLPKLTRQLTQHVVTRWYRAPEIICMNKYGAKIDVWSLGCLFAELLMALKPTSTGSHEVETKKGSLFNGRPCAPLSPTSKKYPGKDQLNMILSYIGTPAEEDIDWIEDDEFRERITETNFEKMSWKEVVPEAEDEELDLLDKMLQFNPNKRFSIDDCLKHPYFDSCRDPQLEECYDPPLPTIKIDISSNPTRDQVEASFLREFRKNFSEKANEDDKCTIF